MQISCFWKLRGGKSSCTSWEEQWKNVLRNICLVKGVLWAPLNFTVGLKHAPHCSVPVVRDLETFLLHSLDVLHVAGDCMCHAFHQPQGDETPAFVVSHPKPGWCSTTLHPSKPCVNPTPRQHKILNLASPILIIWHFLWILTSSWVRQGLYCLCYRGCNNNPECLLSKRYQGILCHFFSCLLTRTWLWGELRMSLTFQGTGDDADSTHCPLSLKGLVWVIHWGPVGH